MRCKLSWLGGVMLCVSAWAGCQNIEYKVIGQLPPPVFGDERIDLVQAAGNSQATTRDPRETPRVAAEQSKQPLPQSKVLRAPVPDWDKHVADNGWKYILIHHSASARGSACAFDREHRARGWDELGYHFVIGNGSETRDGQVEVGSRWRSQKHGAHTKTNDNRFNDTGIGICLVGDFETGGRPSAAQLAALQQLVGWLAERYQIPPGNVLGHGEAVTAMREGRGTKCPGRNFDMDVFRQAVRSARLAAARMTSGG